MMIIAKLVALCAAVLVIALAHATAQAQPSQHTNAGTVHMQNVEGLLERILEAVERDRQQKN